MKKFAVIGNPVAHSFSPALHNWIFNRLGINAEYKRLLVDTSGLAKVIANLRRGSLNGINVTLPHKQAIIPFLDHINQKSEQIHSVNCILRERNRLIGFNTDWYGFTMLLEKNGIPTGKDTFVVLGAGGAAKSVLYSLIQNGVETVIIVNRTAARSQSIVESMASLMNTVSFKTITYDKLEDILPQKATIVNCTPLGMTPNTGTSPFPSHLIQKGHILIDTVYTPPETQFLKDGKSAGAQAIGGLDMFIYQGVASLDLWFHNTFSQKVNIEELRRYLELKLTKGRCL